MTGQERRTKIVQILQSATAPVSGTALGQACGVTRQVVVQDIALLRGAEFDIVSTNRGYILVEENTNPTRMLKMHHTLDQTEDELQTIVDLGGTVVDVTVNHRAYGKMSAKLNIRNRRDVTRFINDIESGSSTPLMMVTSGYHFHRVSAETEEILDEIQEALDKKGYLAPVMDYEKDEFTE